MTHNVVVIFKENLLLVLFFFNHLNHISHYVSYGIFIAQKIN